MVPSYWKGNRHLAQWVKRQRYQHRLLMEGRHSTLTIDRALLLHDVGFCWNTHKECWQLFSEVQSGLVVNYY